LEKIEMKKTLVAIAALSAVSAFAQSTIELTGTMDAGYQLYSAKGNSYATVGSNGSATTALIFKANEDLGGGLSAQFQYEIDPGLTETSNRTGGTPATGTSSNVTSSAGNGQSFVGLTSASVGQIRFGTPNLQTLAASGDGNGGFNTAIGSGYRVTSFDAVRLQNSLRYDTPNMSGFQVSYVLSPKNTAQALDTSNGLSGNLNNQTNGRDGASELGLVYAQGPLTARYAQLSMSQGAKVALTADPLNGITWSARPTGGAFKLNTLSAKYAVNSQLTANYFFQKASSDLLVAGNTTTESTQQFDRTTNGFSASYLATPTVNLLANYAKVKNGDKALSATGASRAGNTASVLGLGADYIFSKRTIAYVRYEIDNDSAQGFRSIATAGYATQNNDMKYTATAVGIRHTY